MAGAQHVHYWIIDEARGRYSWGKCVGCGEERQFSKSVRVPFVNRWVETKGK